MSSEEGIKLTIYGGAHEVGGKSSMFSNWAK